MSGILLIFPAFFGAGAGPLLSLGLSFVPPPYGIASSGILVAASIVLMTVSCSNARSVAQKVEGSMVPVFFFFTSVIALAVLFVGWIFARIFNDEVGKIVSIAISSVLLLISLICVCNNSSCCSNDHEPKRRSQSIMGDSRARKRYAHTLINISLLFQLKRSHARRQRKWLQFCQPSRWNLLF